MQTKELRIAGNINKERASVRQYGDHKKTIYTFVVHSQCSFLQLVNTSYCNEEIFQKEMTVSATWTKTENDFKTYKCVRIAYATH